MSFRGAARLAALMLSLVLACTDDFSIFEGTPGEAGAGGAAGAPKADASADRSMGDAPGNGGNGGAGGQAGAAGEASVDAIAETADDVAQDRSTPDQSAPDVVESGGGDAAVDQGVRDAEAGVVCGPVGSPCCAGNMCNAGGVCSGSTCVVCGAATQA